MSEFYRDNSYETGFRSYLNGVFTLMGAGLAITAAIAYFCYRNLASYGVLYNALSSFPLLMYVVLFAQLGVVFFLSARINNLEVSTARILFFAYCILTGFNFSLLPFAYGIGTVFEAFAYAAVLFIVCSVIGHTTKVDLTKFSGLFMAGLIALVIMSIFSIFFGGSVIIGWLGLALFMGLTAFDVQKIKRNYEYLPMGDVMSKYSVMSALTLYLDFVNMFLYLLRIFGNSKSRR